MRRISLLKVIGKSLLTKEPCSTETRWDVERGTEKSSPRDQSAIQHIASLEGSKVHADLREKH